MTYQLIYADPPWSYGNTVSNGAADNHYGTMTMTDLKRLPVWSLAAPDAVLAMWYTGTHAEEAIALAEAWGFNVRTMKGFTWVKLNQLAEQHINKALRDGEIEDFYDLLALLNTQTRMNGGNYTRANTEDCLIAVRGGGLERVNAAIKQVIYSPLGEHSAKPWEARHRLELLYGDVKRIELFSRGDAESWHHWGNENPRNNIELMPAAFSPSDNQSSHIEMAAARLQPQTQQQNTPEIITAVPLPETENDVWPEEVTRIAGRIDNLPSLPQENQRKIMQHINHLLLEREPSGVIISMVQALTKTFGEFPNA